MSGCMACRTSNLSTSLTLTIGEEIVCCSQLDISHENKDEWAADFAPVVEVPVAKQGPDWLCSVGLQVW